MHQHLDLSTASLTAAWPVARFAFSLVLALFLTTVAIRRPTTSPPAEGPSGRLVTPASREVFRRPREGSHGAVHRVDEGLAGLTPPIGDKRDVGLAVLSEFRQMRHRYRDVVAVDEPIESLAKVINFPLGRNRVIGAPTPPIAPGPGFSHTETVYRGSPREESEPTRACPPEYLPRRAWSGDPKVVADLAQKVLAAVQITDQSPASVKRFRTDIAAFVDWAMFTYDLDAHAVVEALTDPRVVRYFCTQVRPQTANTYSQLSRLHRVCQGLREVAGMAPLPDDRTLTAVVASPARANTPYTDEEKREIREWSLVRPSHYSVRDARVVVALGLGAGLMPTEIMPLRKRDVVVDDIGVLITPQPPSKSTSRTIPMTAPHDEVLAEHVSHLTDDEYLVRPRTVRRGDSRDTTALDNFRRLTTKARPGGLCPTFTRLRLTWLRDHIAARVPAPLLQEAVGWHSLKKLKPMAVETCDMTSLEFDDWLAGGGTDLALQ